jgi:hypothetical protein
LFQFYAARLADAVPAAPEGEDPDDALDEDDEESDDELVEDEPAINPAPTGAPPKRAVEDEQVLELVALSEVPAAFRARFELGDAGAERARRAWSERLRDEQRQAREREAQAREAEAAAPAVPVRAPRRISGGGSPFPRGGRGHGPSGERAGG